MDDLELDPVGILEIDGVILRVIFRKSARRIVKRRDFSRAKEFKRKAINILRTGNGKGEMVQTAGFAMIGKLIVGFGGPDKPNVGLAVGGSNVLGAMIENAIIEIGKEVAIKLQIGDVELEMVEVGFHHAGSYPCPPHGWQRRIRRVAFHEPRMGPYFWMASIAY
jgi:hypothetical protein